MAGLKKNIIFYILLFIDFYIIPRFIKDTGSDCDVNDYSSDMFNNICFLWNQEWL